MRKDQRIVDGAGCICNRSSELRRVADTCRKSKALENQRLGKEAGKSTGSTGKTGTGRTEKDYPQKSKEDQLMDGEAFGGAGKRKEGRSKTSLAKTDKSVCPSLPQKQKTIEGASKLFTRKNQRNHRSKRTSGNTECKGRKKQTA